MRSRALTLLSGIGALLALATVLALAWRASDGVTAPGTLPGLPERAMTVGLQDERLAVATPDEISTRLQRLESSGATVVRVPVAWAQVAPAKPANPADPADPAYSWARTDAVLDGLRDRKITPLVVFSQTPSWSNGGKAPEWLTNVDDYAAFVRAFAARYSGTAHAAVRLYEPWNEPNNGAMLMPQWSGAGASATVASPELYAKILQRARAEIRAVTADAAVIGLGLADVQDGTAETGAVGVTEFIAAFRPFGATMDGAAVHLAPTAAPAESSLARLPQVLNEINTVAADHDVLVTSVGYATGPGGVTEADQAQYLTQTLATLARTPRVRLAVWEAVDDTLGRPAGLIRADGTEKPAWKVFAAAQKSVPSETP